MDSETRWRLVRKLRQRGETQQLEPQIRAVEEQDLPQIRDIYNYFIRNTVITFDDRPVNLDHWHSQLELLGRLQLPFLVIVKGQEVLGFAFVAPWRQRSGYQKVVEDSIYLSAAATGKQLGSRLFEALLNECRNREIREVIAVIPDRGAQASIALHKKFGFQEQGHLAKVAIRFGKPIGSYLFSLQIGKG